MTRISIDEQMLATARVTALRGTCPRLKVGAVLVQGGRIVSAGYNGAPAGLPHCSHPVDEPCPWDAVHAEANALVCRDAALDAFWEPTLYVTHAPCKACAGLAINAGIQRVVYERDYRTREGLDLLAERQVRVNQASCPMWLHTDDELAQLQGEAWDAGYREACRAADLLPRAA